MTMYDGKELRPRQVEAQEYINDPNQYRNLIVRLPTGYGKTVIGMFAIDKALQNGERVIFTSPLKALTAEQVETFGKKWGDDKVCKITGEDRDIKFDVDSLQQYSIFVFTYEKLKAVLKSIMRRDLFFDDLNVSTVIIDEIHNVGDGGSLGSDGKWHGGRGPKLESTIVQVMEMYPFVHIVGLSATIRNADELAVKWKAKLISADPSERPVPLKIETVEVPYVWNFNEKFNVKMDEVRKIVSRYPDSKILVFCSSRDRSVQVAKALNKNTIGKMYGKELIEKLISGGTCYHNASLNPELRKKIETSFRNDPKFTVLSCTPTLAQGVNTPADIVIIFDMKRYNYLRSEEEFIKQNELHQMIGRAGRPGMSKFGLAFVIADDRDMPETEEMLQGSVEVRSHIKDALKSSILDFLVTFVRDKKTLESSMGKALDPPKTIELAETSGWLLKYKFIKEAGLDNNGIMPTYIGRQTTNAFIEPETTLHILKINAEASKQDRKFDMTEDYVWLFSNLMDVEEFTCNVLVRATSKVDNACLEIVSNCFPGSFRSDAVKKAFAFNFYEYLDIISDDKETIKEIKFSDGDIYLIRQVSERIINAASMICSKNQEIYKNLAMMVSAGIIDLELVKLRRIDGIGETRMQHLINAHITKVSDFYTSDTGFLAKVLGVKAETVEKMKSQARMMY